MCEQLKFHVQAPFILSCQCLHLGDLCDPGVSLLVAWSALGTQARGKACANLERGLRATSYIQLLGLEGGGDTDIGCLSPSSLLLDFLTPGEGHSQRKDRVGPSRVFGPA